MNEQIENEKLKRLKLASSPFSRKQNNGGYKAQPKQLIGFPMASLNHQQLHFNMGFNRKI